MILSVILPQGSSGAAAAAMMSIVSVVHRGASYPSYTPQARVIVAACTVDYVLPHLSPARLFHSWLIFLFILLQCKFELETYYTHHLWFV